MADAGHASDAMPALSVDRLGFSYGPRVALKDVCITVPRGHFCALLGPNGAGKSTLFALLSGLLSRDEGSIRVAGIDMRASPRQALARMGIVFQETTLDLDLTVRPSCPISRPCRACRGGPPPLP